MTTNTDHVTIANTDHGDYEMRCLHCGTTTNVGAPLPLGESLERMRRFSRQHAHCRPQPQAAEAVEQESGTREVEPCLSS